MNTKLCLIVMSVDCNGTAVYHYFEDDKQLFTIDLDEGISYEFYDWYIDYIMHDKHLADMKEMVQALYDKMKRCSVIKFADKPVWVLIAYDHMERILCQLNCHC